MYILAIESLIGKNTKHLLYDEYKREGYLLEKNDIYTFNPIEIDNENSPMIYLKFPLKKKPTNYPFTFVDITKKVKKKKDKDIETIYNNIFKTYNNILDTINIYIDKQDNNKEKICMELVLNKLSDIDIINVLKYIDTLKQKDKYTKIILSYFTNNLNIYRSENTYAIFSGNLCYQWGRNKYGNKKEKWGSCDIDINTLMISLFKKNKYNKIWRKVKLNDRIREGKEITKGEYINTIYNLGLCPTYMGLIEKKSVEDSAPKYFKILNMSNRKSDILSKRNEIRGSVCKDLSAPFY